MVLAFGLTLVTAFTSYAGPFQPTPTPSATPTVTATRTPTPTIEYCDFSCDLDKSCSVGGSQPSNQCVASPGQEVTYTYKMDIAGSPVELWDDKLGFLGSAGTGTLTVTTKLRETTTNTAWLVASQDGCACGRCDCVFGNVSDSVTVSVVTPTPVPTPTPIPCSAIWPETQIVTTAKGQSPTNNAKVTHAITGHIIDPGSLSDTAHRIEVCAGTRVTSRVTDTTGNPTNTASGSLLCTAGACWGNVNVIEKYQSYSADGRDKDSITFLPK